MRKMILLIAVLLTAAHSARAQDSYPGVELFGGYSYLNVDAIERESFHGFGVSFAGNLTRNIGAVAELSGNYGNIQLPGLDADANIYTFLFGPRISLRGENATVFGHVLIGGARTSVEDFGSDTDFALAVGGGIDINASKNVSIRVLQLDYLPISNSDDWAHNFRAQAGIVIKLGGR